MNKIDLNGRREESLYKDLQIVVIDGFYDIARQGDDCPWLWKLFKFKVQSFLASYPYGMLSFGAADLIGVHWLLCQKQKDGDLKILMGIKMIDSAKTEAFHMAFPALEPVKDEGQEVHRAAIHYELERGKREGYPVGYVASWVVDPEAHKDPAMAKILKKMTSAFISQWICLFDVKVALAFASLRFHVEKFHAYLGVMRFTGPKGEHLPDFKMKAAFDEPLCASVFYRKNHTKETLQDMEDMRRLLWDDRIVIAPEGSALYEGLPAAKKAA